MPTHEQYAERKTTSRHHAVVTLTLWCSCVLHLWTCGHVLLRGGSVSHTSLYTSYSHFIFVYSYLIALIIYSFQIYYLCFSLHLFIAINTYTASIGPKALRHETGNLDSGGIITSFLDLFITWDLARRFQ